MGDASIDPVRGVYRPRRTHSPLRDRDLAQGIRIHAFVFAVVMGLLFVVNWMTRGSDGGWWVVLPLQIWAVAWGLHVFAAMQIAAFRNELDDRD